MNTTARSLIRLDARAAEPRPGHGPAALVHSVRDLTEFLDDDGGGFDGDFVAASPVMRELVEQARRVAASKASVLIEGETGTGKELFARLIHRASPRCGQPFVRVNCAALSESLVESELFGHERGAFTGAAERRPGRFELAHGGTLLLDEISEMSVHLQAKLLRALEEEEFERVGGNDTIRVDVRVIATTNRRPEQAIADGQFRRDLYYRLGVIQLFLPPLRERREQIPALADHFFRRYQCESAHRLHGVSKRAMERLALHDWPGNARELRNVVHRACILSAGPEIDLRDLPQLQSSPMGEADSGTLEAIERGTILKTLQEVNGNKTAAARKLGVTARTLLNKMNKYARDEVA